MMDVFIDKAVDYMVFNDKFHAILISMIAVLGIICTIRGVVSVLFGV